MTVQVNENLAGTRGGIISFTWATLPLASAYLGTAWVSDIPTATGSYWVSNGTRWRPMNNALALYNNPSVYTKTNVTTASGSITAADIVFTIPIEIGVWKNGDFLECHNTVNKIGGVADTLNCKIYIGTSPTVLGTATTVDYGCGTVTVRAPGEFKLLRESSTSVVVVSSSAGFPAYSSVTYAASTATVSDMDANKMYLQFVAYRAAGTAGTESLEWHFTRLHLYTNAN